MEDINRSITCDMYDGKRARYDRTYNTYEITYDTNRRILCNIYMRMLVTFLSTSAEASRNLSTTPAGAWESDINQDGDHNALARICFKGVSWRFLGTIKSCIGLNDCINPLAGPISGILITFANSLSFTTCFKSSIAWKRLIACLSVWREGRPTSWSGGNRSQDARPTNVVAKIMVITIKILRICSGKECIASIWSRKNCNNMLCGVFFMLLGSMALIPLLF